MQTFLIICICITIANAQNVVDGVIAGAKTRAFACENSDLNFSCPQGLHLNIFEVNSNYGNTDTVTCPDALLTTNCNREGIDSLSQCNGKNSCSAPAVDANYGCVVSYKYLGEY